MGDGEPLFILCPPRSFSSLVSTMLGQHPECYGLPELNLFVADDLAGAWRWMERLMPHGQDGLLRALAQLAEGEQSEATIARARAWVVAHGDWSPRRVFGYLQHLAGDRRLVEKSPAVVFAKASLARLYAAFPDADYLHLVRHPLSTSRSLRALAERSAEWGGRLSRLDLDAERAWLTGHKNILDFAGRLALGQYMRIKGEALLAQPRLYLPQIAEWLGLRSDEEAIAAMLHPEDSPFARPGPAGATYGNDLDFLANPVLDPSRLAAMAEPTLAEAGGGNGTPPAAAVVKYTLQFGYR